MSDWKKAASKRRAERHIKTPDVDQKPNNQRKNKKKWCRGKEGVEHKPVCLKYAEVKHTSHGFYNDWRLLACSDCGKELDYYYPMNYVKPELKKPPPPWVDK